MKEITDKHERPARPALFDCTDEQCVCCPRCYSDDVEPVERRGWEAGEFWECKACRIVFEIRYVAREIGPVEAWL